jgi:hypothetical protein
LDGLPVERQTTIVKALTAHDASGRSTARDITYHSQRLAYHDDTT